MFLTARLFMYQQIYYHRSVRAIDLDLAGVFRPSVLAIFGDGSPADDLGHYADLDEYALLHQAALWARGEALSAEPQPGQGTVTPAVGRAWSSILLRRPSWRAGAELRLNYETGERARVQSRTRTSHGRPGRDRRPPGRSYGHRLTPGDRRPGRRTGAAAQRRPGEAAGVFARGPQVRPRGIAEQARASPTRSVPGRWASEW